MAGTCLVTGGAGLIGSLGVDDLLARGDRVRVLDDFSTGKRENLAHCRDDVEVVEGDVRDGALVRAVAHGCDVALAPGGTGQRRAFFRASGRRPDRQPPRHPERAALRLPWRGLAAVTVASSCAEVYGDSEELPLTEDAPRRPPSLPMPPARRPVRTLRRVLGAAREIPTASLRYFNVYGPRQDAGSEYSGVVSRFVTGVLSGRGLAFFGDGRQSRDFVYVEDVARANALASRRWRAGGRASMARPPARQRSCSTSARAGRPRCSRSPPRWRPCAARRCRVPSSSRARARSVGRALPCTASAKPSASSRRGRSRTVFRRHSVGTPGATRLRRERRSRSPW